MIKLSGVISTIAVMGELHRHGTKIMILFDDIKTIG